MSRAKFEEELKNSGATFGIYWSGDRYLNDWTQSYWLMWLAGRESMRDEAEKACGDIGQDAYKAFHAIRKIEP